MSRQKRSTRYRRHWSTLIAAHGSLCFYCQIEPATTIDHIIPVSFGGSDDIENLVPACITCNLTASDKVFDDVWVKRQYIIGRRKKKLTHAVCNSCFLPYEYRTHSPSLFLCAECYDKEYGTKLSSSPRWKGWVSFMEDAGIFVEAHRMAAKKIEDIPGGPQRNEYGNRIIRNIMGSMGYYTSD